jgi:hypothetical protein
MSCVVLEVLEGQGGKFSKVQAILFTEAGDSRPYTTLYVCYKTWRHMPEGRKLRSFGIENFKSRLCYIATGVWM